MHLINIRNQTEITEWHEQLEESDNSYNHAQQEKLEKEKKKLITGGGEWIKREGDEC